MSPKPGKALRVVASLNVRRVDLFTSTTALSPASDCCSKAWLFQITDKLSWCVLLTHVHDDKGLFLGLELMSQHKYNMDAVNGSTSEEKGMKFGLHLD